MPTITTILRAHLKTINANVRFEVLTAVLMNNAISWDIALCRLYVNRRYGRTYHLHLQGRKSAEVPSHLL
jgi:hypothetical protein